LNGGHLMDHLVSKQ